MKKSIFFMVALLSVGQLRAEVDRAYFDFGEAKITVEENTILPESYVDLLNQTATTNPLDGVALDRIVVIGKQFWNFIVDNQPVINLKSNIAHVVPEGISAWQSLEGWDRPKSYRYNVQYKNAYGQNVVDMTYNVLFTPGGNVNGQGQYLANVTILPSVEAMWGYTVDASVNIHKPLNAGSASDPVATALMDVNWKVSTVVKKSVDNMVYSIYGDGSFEELF